MGYKFSKTSEKRMVGVHSDLIKVVRRALEISKIDFMVYQGLRTKAEQKALVRSGASWTMNSRHLTGHAIDLIPLFNGKISYHWSHYYPVADAMKQAAKELGVKVRWGGNWKYHNIASTKVSAKELHALYRGKAHDGAHFELSKRFYK